MIRNNKEEKHYNKFCKMHKKIIIKNYVIYTTYVYFDYYYIKPCIL